MSIAETPYSDDYDLDEIEKEKVMYQESLERLPNNQGTEKRRSILESGLIDIIAIIYPKSIVERLKIEYGADKDGLYEAQKKLSNIKMMSIDKKKGNTIEINNKIFSILSAQSNGEDVLQGIDGYEHVSNISGNAVEREVKKNGSELFKDDDEFTIFLEKFLPGKTKVSRIKNFADLMGLQYSGHYCIKEGWKNISTFGHAYISYPDKYSAYNLRFTTSDADIFPCSLDNAQPVIVRNGKQD